MKEKKRINTNIGAGSIVKVKVGYTEKEKREGKSMRTRKDMVVCIQDVLGKKKLRVKLKYGQKKYISASLL